MITKSGYGLTRSELFSKYKGEHTILFETGTHKGDAVQTALDLDFKKILSVEVMADMFEKCKARFEKQIEEGVVTLYAGGSNDRMNEMLEQVDSPTMFWLDAHFGDGTPVWGELEAIKNHPIKTHTILIDDVPLYFNKEELEARILEINPNYLFVYEDILNEGINVTYTDYDLVAYIPEQK
jgi:hypothetical protein